ncbi:alpha/beta hydrolase (plasmid) [Pseudonocardia bannensis]|uniref:Alpha/beta hydrolase n=1 Tax=Pseudonocardia bannensis TaxID=630973 RepID=A0A848DN94_9PSEU|nr:alpha/beta hydrolase [Pseudonocardia bannensis]NMH94178.1 alpha/beta hydrolase [Pseudonocardia bannensis]
MPSPQSDALRARFLAMAARKAANPEMDLPTMRDMQEALHLETAEPEGVSYAEVSAGGVPALWCQPDGAVPDRVLLYLHGGGFVTNSMHSHRKLAAHVAKAAGVRALVLDYRLAPEHPFPAQLEDAVAAYRWLLAQGLRAEHIATAGDSAGGNLATSVVLKLREEGEPLPAAIVGFSPWYDLECLGKTLDTNAATDVLVQRAELEMLVPMFLGENGSPSDPLANPLRADPTGLPPMFLTAGDHETLQDDAERFAEQATAAGVDVTVEIAPGMQHIYPLMAGRAPEADAVIAGVAAWVRPKLGLG